MMLDYMDPTIGIRFSSAPYFKPSHLLYLLKLLDSGVFVFAVKPDNTRFRIF